MLHFLLQILVGQWFVCVNNRRRLNQHQPVTHTVFQGEACKGKVRGRAEGAGALRAYGRGETTGAEEAADGDRWRADEAPGRAQAERAGDPGHHTGTERKIYILEVGENWTRSL